MNKKLFQSVTELQTRSEKAKQIVSGRLGLTIDGHRAVEVPTRRGYVYVRLRDAQNEVIQAFNDQVSPVYDLPVLLERQGNRWRVTDRDLERYSNWGTWQPFLPKHGLQHSFDRLFGGGDPVWVYSDQFMPLLVMPSGTYGSNNAIVGGYMLQRQSDFIYVGNTGTISLIQYRPTNDMAIMGLVYMNKDTGNPGILINSGTPFSASITGSAQIAPYIPYPSTTQEPLYAFRLTSGTQTIQWNDLYDTRQFYGGQGGGPGGVDAADVSFTPTGDIAATDVQAAIAEVDSEKLSSNLGANDKIVITDGSGNVTTDTELSYNATDNVITLGPGTVIGSPNSQEIVADDAIASQVLASFGDFVPEEIFVRGRSAHDTPGSLLNGDSLGSIHGQGYYDDGASNALSQAQVTMRFEITEDWSTGNLGCKIVFATTPNTTDTLTDAFTIDQDGNVNIEYGKTYNMGGLPHSHTELAGAFAPNLTPGTNCTSATADGDFMYMRIGNIIIVHGSLQIDPTAAGACDLNMSLPVGSDLASVYELSGNGICSGQYPGIFEGDTANDEAKFSFTAIDGTSRRWKIDYMYQVI